MNNPKSFEHVKTLFVDTGSYLIVETTYRGTNAFGGVVTNTFGAKMSLDGQLQELYPNGIPSDVINAASADMHAFVENKREVEALRAKEEAEGERLAAEAAKEAAMTPEERVARDAAIAEELRLKNEAAAANKLFLAKKQIERNVSPTLMLEQIISQYPDTDAAREAEEILKKR
ncbi:MAG: hypothetical protein R3C18_11530 [Planctomycetaceae bacterium]